MNSTAPFFVFDNVVKPFGGAAPLRVARLALAAGDQIVLSGLDALAAEMFMHVLTGAALPEQGTVHLFGRPTHAMATDTDWLAALDHFGLVSNRAVLLEQSTIAQNLALPITLSIDPMAEDVRARVERLAGEVGLAPGRLDAPAGTMTADERMRAHLARAAAPDPEVLLLEHPTVTLSGGGAAFGETLRALSASRGLSWLAISDDEDFARASGGRSHRLNPSTGDVRAAGGFWRRWFTS